MRHRFAEAFVLLLHPHPGCMPCATYPVYIVQYALDAQHSFASTSAATHATQNTRTSSASPAQPRYGDLRRAKPKRGRANLSERSRGSEHAAQRWLGRRACATQARPRVREQPSPPLGGRAQCARTAWEERSGRAGRSEKNVCRKTEQTYAIPWTQTRLPGVFNPNAESSKRPSAIPDSRTT